MHNGDPFLVTAPVDGEPTRGANGSTGIEDPPGARKGGFGPDYLARLRDPDGNKTGGLLRMG